MEYLNEKEESLLGYSNAEIESKPIYDTFQAPLKTDGSEPISVRLADSSPKEQDLQDIESFEKIDEIENCGKTSFADITNFKN